MSILTFYSYSTRTGHTILVPLFSPCYIIFITHICVYILYSSTDNVVYFTLILSTKQLDSLSLETMATTDDLELLPCSFQFHNFHDQVGEVRMHCQIMKMENSLYLWIGDYNEQSMKDLALAFIMDNEPKRPICTKILGPIADEVSTNLATRLSKKSGKPVYVSFNISADNVTLPNIEKRIHEELKKHPELLDSSQ